MSDDAPVEVMAAVDVDNAMRDGVRESFSKRGSYLHPSTAVRNEFEQAFSGAQVNAMLREASETWRLERCAMLLELAQLKQELRAWHEAFPVKGQ